MLGLHITRQKYFLRIVNLRGIQLYVRGFMRFLIICQIVIIVCLMQIIIFNNV